MSEPATHRWFCTYFDAGYLPRALALHESLRRHAGPFELVALCLDGEAWRGLERRRLPGVTAVELAALERFDPDLPAARASRSRVEYYFTLSPVLPLYVLERFPEAESVTYLDADLYFFSSPEPVFREIGEAHVAMVPHRFAPPYRHLERHGRYNVGWLTFRRSGEARRCLEWWRDRCLEWCHDRCEPGRFADQKYLDQWPERFDGVHEVRHPGANVAPWNVSRHRIEDGPDRVRVDGEPLVFFHFHGLRRLRPWLWDPNLARYGARLSPVLRRRVFAPYVRALARHARDGGGGPARHRDGGAPFVRSLARDVRGALAGAYLWTVPAPAGSLARPALR